ncbi:MAG: hypothetical protein H6810_07630 [Phycisphaeraceae bacterium]|nr:MAG: hypothetical protein H6810_07630 [Phycisphaeraceae bacterium]
MSTAFASLLACGMAYAAVPFAVDTVGLRAVLHQDVRVLWLGDSYCVPYGERPSGASLLSWRIDRWSAYAMGDGPNWSFMKYDLLDPSVATVDAENGYRLFQTGPDAVVRYALPLWRLREYHGEASTPTDLIRYRFVPGDVSLGFVGSFAAPGQTAMVRTMMLEPPGSPPMLPGVRLTPDGGATVSFDPRVSTRPKRLDGLDPDVDAPSPPADGQIWASPVDVPVTLDASDRFGLTLGVDAAEPGGGYVFPAGLAAYSTDKGARVPGLYFTVLADTSWSYQGFGLDLPSGVSPAIVKTYSQEQLEHWLDVTTIDPAQPIYVFFIVNVEDIEPAVAAAQMEAAVNQTEAAAAHVGAEVARFCFVIPWMHRIEGQDILGRHEEQRDAAFALANARADVSAVSIYDYTDGVMFNGSAESKQWLADHGYDHFTYGGFTADLSVDGGGPNGGLLDIYRSHPASRDAGAFFAHVIEKAIVDACPADYAEPYGVLDLADITGFLTRFIDQKPSADLADPIGVHDLADVTAFVTSFLAGCSGN